MQRTQREMEALHREYCEAMQSLYGEYQQRRQALDAAEKARSCMLLRLELMLCSGVVAEAHQWPATRRLGL